jgi:drug/metabolite transporter (DMT)-like permease
LWAVAVGLLRISNGWAALFAWPLLGERINRQKGIALLWGLASGVLCGLLVPTLAGHALFAFDLRFLEATVATISATVEPVMAMLWAALFLGESLT